MTTGSNTRAEAAMLAEPRAHNPKTGAKPMVIEELNTVAAEQVFRALSYPRLSITQDVGGFAASTYYPSGNVCQDKGCFGRGETIAEALEKLADEWLQAEAEGVKLKTAAECKAAVIGLMNEHMAAPASFRDAVDALPVA